MDELVIRQRKFRTWLAAIILVGLVLLYQTRPDILQLAHWWPAAMWSPLLIAPWVSLRPRPFAKPCFLFVSLWLGYLQYEGDLGVRFEAIQDSPCVRVTTLNCGGGSMEAALEAIQSGSAIVLLQEVPRSKDLVDAATAAGYAQSVVGPDCAIFSTSKLEDPVIDRDYVAATIDAVEVKIRVVSLRLPPPTFRLDWWSPVAWRAYTEDVQARRERFQQIAERERLGKQPWIVGGDFNSTNPRIVNDILRGSESMRQAGRGWRGTGTNDFPFAQIDQLWGSAGWREGRVKKSLHSDHRMLKGLTHLLY